MDWRNYLRTFILGLGVVSAWSALILQFSNFYGAVAGATNPYLTPCLYGSLCFLAALAWSGYLIVRPNAQSEVWLQRLLAFGIVFAAVVVAYDCADYLGLFRFGVPIVCSPGVNPIYTPCFRGLVFFALAYAAGAWQIRTRNVAN
jgi:uncharacterized membrane protein YbhN (UPF0104 family)